MDRNNNRGNNGFTMGFVLGTALTLLYTTKTGKKILKVVTEEGGQGISELKKHLKELNVELEEDAFLEEDVEPINMSKTEPSSVDFIDEEDDSPKAPRRLFKGIPKK